MSALEDLLSRVMGIDEIYRHTLISLTAKMLITLVGFFATIYFAHIAGASVLGLYFIFLAYYGIFDLISDGGFGSAAIKRISEGFDQDAFFSAYTVVRVCLSCASIVILWFAYLYLKNIDSPEIIFWLGLGMVSSVFAGITFTGVYGAGKVGVSQISGLVQTISQFLLQILGIFLGFGFAGLAGGFVAGLLVQALVNFRHLTFRFVRFGREHIRSLFDFSFWSFLSSGGALVYAYADTLLIAYYMSSADVGIYRTIFQFTTMACFITLALQTVLFPKISSWNSMMEKDKIGKTISRAVTIALLLAIPMCIGGWVLGDRLIYYLYGSSFIGGTSCLWILLVVQIINVFMLLFTMSLNAINLPRESFRITIIASMINILLNILLLPVMGILGAALATCCAMLFNAILAYQLLSKNVELQFERKSIKSICCAAILMGICVAAFRLLIPLSTFLLTIAAVLFGVIVFSLIIFKLDETMYSDIFRIVKDIGSNRN